MRTLAPPAIDEAELYDRLLTRRVAETARALHAARPTVLAAYSSYASSAVIDLETVITDDALAERLRSNYPVMRSGALKADGALVLARSRICCLCGLRNVSELDHYLPNKLFPEYSTYTMNLVPVCGTCNKNKAEDYRTPTGSAAFIHAYLDRLPAVERFLSARICIDRAVIPEFELRPTPAIADDTFDVLRGQFDRLELASIYADETIELLTEKHGAIEAYYAEGGAAAVRKYLARDARSAETHYGLNHWKPVALLAAAESRSFCDGGFELLIA